MNLVLLASLVVGRHLVAAHEQPERFRCVAQLHAEVHRPAAVDPDAQLRLAEVQGRVHVHDTRKRPRRLGHRRGGVAEGGEVWGR